MSQGIAVLDGYSGCGKTTLLHRIREESDHGVLIVSYRVMLDRMLKHIWKDACTDVEDLWGDLPWDAIVCVEDVDLLKRKTETQQLFIRVLSHTAQTRPVIVTGNNMEQHTPAFMTQLPARIWQRRKTA